MSTAKKSYYNDCIKLKTQDALADIPHGEIPWALAMPMPLGTLIVINTKMCITGCSALKRITEANVKVQLLYPMQVSSLNSIWYRS